MKINNFRGDLSSISSETATLTAGSRYRMVGLGWGRRGSSPYWMHASAGSTQPGHYFLSWVRIGHRSCRTVSCNVCQGESLSYAFERMRLSLATCVKVNSFTCIRTNATVSCNVCQGESLSYAFQRMRVSLATCVKMNIFHMHSNEWDSCFTSSSALHSQPGFPTSASFFKIKHNIFLDTLIQKILVYIMKIH